MILDYILPNRVYERLTENIAELSKYSKYRSLIFDLETSGKLDAMGMSLDRDGNSYIGINLNPELLTYSDTSQTSVELKLIGEKMGKYNDFFTKEGLLDSIKVDYDRVKNDDYYGYILKITYNFKKYRRKDLIYDTSYFTLLGVSIVSLAIYLLL